MISPSASIRRRTPRTASGRLLARAQREMCFTIHAPRAVPRGLELVNIVWVPGLDDYCCLAYAGAGNRGFRVLQRVASDGTLDGELALTGDAHERIDTDRRSYALYSGMYLTEPIDGRYWAPSRRRLVWYDGDLRLEVEGVLDGWNTADRLVEIAETVRPLRRTTA